MKWHACSDRVTWDDFEIDVTGHSGWCRDPVVPDGEEVGFIGCEEDLDRHHLERRLRSGGFDPLAVPVVRLSDVDRDSRDRVRARLAAASARVAAYPGSRPEHLKPVMPPTVSRRSFLSFHLPAYRTVPHPDPAICGAGDGCRACVDVCPHGALDWSRGTIAHDRLSCAGCGRCITACPAGAMANPAFTPAQLQAEIEALASATDEPVGILLHCVRMEVPAARTGWFNVAVPCVGMLPTNWVLAPLLAGAASVSVADCGCAIEPDASARSTTAVEGAREWLEAAGWADAVERVADSPTTSLPEPLTVDGPGSGFAPGGGVAVAATVGRAVWESESAPIGVVTIDDEVCTGCELCATVCPADALASEAAAGGLEITFDPNRCTACGQCVTRCPEPGAIDKRTVVDGDELSVGRRSLVVHSLVSCVRCGGTVAPRVALDRIAEAIGDDAATLRQVSSLCLDCRGTTLVF